MNLDGVGIWSSPLRYGDAGEAAEAAAELDELGFTALWIPDVGGPVLDSVRNLLGATKQAIVATGILNMWMHEPADVAAAHAEFTGEYGPRFLLGLGISHAPLIDQKVRAHTRSRWRPRAHSSTVSTPHPHPCRPTAGCWRRWDPRCCSSRPTAPGAPTRTW